MPKAILLLLLTIITGNIYAQNNGSSGVQSTSLDMSNALELTFTSTNNSIDIEFNSLNDMLNGVETAKHEIRVRSNKKFKVTVKPSSNTMTYSGPSLIGSLLKCSNVMKIQVADNKTGGTQPFTARVLGWQSFSAWGFPVTLLTNCKPGGNQTFTVKYKATPGINCVAGTYTTEMVYTATQQ